MATQTTQEKEARTYANQVLASIASLKKTATDTQTKCKKLAGASTTASALWDICRRLQVDAENYDKEIKRSMAGYFI